jgi:hypothetical protein
MLLGRVSSMAGIGQCARLSIAMGCTCNAAHAVDIVQRGVTKSEDNVSSRVWLDWYTKLA